MERVFRLRFSQVGFSKLSVQKRSLAFSLLAFDSCIHHFSRIKRGKQLLFFLLFLINTAVVFPQKGIVIFQYDVSIPQPASHTYNIELKCSNWEQDTICFKMPVWMPGYYQVMDYANSVENLLVKEDNGISLPVEKTNVNTWVVSGVKNKSFVVKYTIRTKSQFVANSYVDNEHAYIIPENTFLYIKGYLNVPVSVSF